MKKLTLLIISALILLICGCAGEEANDFSNDGISENAVSNNAKEEYMSNAHSKLEESITISEPFSEVTESDEDLESEIESEPQENSIEESSIEESSMEESSIEESSIEESSIEESSIEESSIEESSEISSESEEESEYIPESSEPESYSEPEQSDEISESESSSEEESETVEKVLLVTADIAYEDGTSATLVCGTDGTLELHFGNGVSMTDMARYEDCAETAKAFIQMCDENISKAEKVDVFPFPEIGNTFIYIKTDSAVYRLSYQNVSANNGFINKIDECIAELVIYIAEKIEQ